MTDHPDAHADDRADEHADEHADRTVIRTPDQRLRVFVSSTLTELAPEREAVARAISSLRLTPVMFELGARPYPPQELYRAYLEQSDIFIGLYWQRYGWVGPGMDISGLEDELQLSQSLPRLLYIKEPAPDREPRLATMITDIQALAGDSYRSFRTPRELGRLVADDLALLLSERFAASARPALVASPDRSPAAASSTAANATRPGARSLPVTSTSLIGRRRDIEQVLDMLQSPDARLITLTGPGGVGKTRLAIAVAEAFDADPHVPKRYRTRFVPLAAITDAEMVLPRVAAVVGATIEGTRSPLDTLIEFFAENPTLLVLDNLEQVTDVAADLDRLLTGSPDVRILATSRTVLRIRAEREYAVAPLTVPSFVEPPSITDVEALPAVQLFVDRARAVRHDFDLSEANSVAVAEICRRLDGLPLAIELAAARSRLLDPPALLARLATVLDGLGSGPADLPERQRTLRSTVEWSIGLLDDSERQLLVTLSVFAEGWTLAAAANVANRTEDETLDLLDALAGHSLVNVDTAGLTPGEPRFRMLTSVRELAAERLAADPSGPAIQARHARYFASLVERGDWPMERQTDWVDRLRDDEENLRIAVRWLFGNDIAPLPNIFRMLWLFWQMRDRMPEGRAWIDELHRKADALDEHANVEVLFTLVVTSVEVGDDTRALAAMEAAQEVLERLDDASLVNALQLAVAWTLPIVDDFAGALAAAESALVGFRERGEPFVAFATLTVGMLEMTFGHDDRARALLLQVDDLGDRFGNNWLTSSARTQLSVLAVHAGDLDSARSLLIEAADAIEDSQPSTLTVTFALVALAQLALAEGDATRAARALGAASGLRQRAGLRPWPLTRRSESELITRVQARLEMAAYDVAFTSGAELRQHDALGLVRDGR